MIFLAVCGFFVFLAGSLVISSFAATLAAKASRAPVLWVPLTLVTCVLFNVVYLSGLSLARSLLFAKEGEAPNWDRLLGEWREFGLTYGVLFGVVGWFWCLKRAGQYTQRRGDAADRGLRDALVAAIAKAAAEQNQDADPSRESSARPGTSEPI
jgi:hypothetical protein